MEEDVLNEFLFSVINASIDSVILSNVIGAFDSISALNCEHTMLAQKIFNV